MKTLRTLCLTVSLLVVTHCARGQVPTARVGDVTRLQGQGTNVLLGYGLVTGLDKTGDGAKFLPTMRALAATMERFGQSASRSAGSRQTAAGLPRNGSGVKASTWKIGTP